MEGRHILFASAITLASAGALAFEGDAQAAQGHVSMCIGCHGIPGYRTAFPEVYPVPKLGGQHPEYLVRALRAYRDGTRSHPSMQAIARGLTDQQMADLAAYYGQPAEGTR
ncbi:MAG TPA: cytochrome c [Rhodocyclaceae bacterium]|nr:cytochrome c [Rhodocyclaceae bacterium]